MSTVATRPETVGSEPGARAAALGVAGYLAVNTVGNLASSSDVERYVFGPSTAVAAALTAVVARRSTREIQRRLVEVSG